jgi:predicted metal-dependent enzyme (double-stranded beta helix superfamily)
MGVNNGDSPGQMLVMEIWPKGGHYSPIHSHANCEAIIRVLHGSINVHLYPYLCGQADEIEPFAVASFNQGDVTWISPTLNQIHKLHNISNENTCITIQCYEYDESDTKHYDYFDYIDDDGKIQQYEPDSDCDFIEFKRIIQQEWAARTA